MLPIQEIPLSKLVPSKANVRRTNPRSRIDELAASIQAHGLLQNLTVRPVPKAKGMPNGGGYEVLAGSRRLAALKALAKKKVIAPSVSIPCHVVKEGVGEEISLAENVMQCPMHPADQYQAFAKLHDEHGMSAEDIAARFGVSAAVVKQRLKLGAISPKLMKAYRAEELNLDQLTAFAITDDHAAQERVWEELPEWGRSRSAILEALSEGQVPCDDRRAVFVGAKAYKAAGGAITRDLFDEEGGGYFTDPALLNRLVREKLQAEAEKVVAEGWKWVVVDPEFDYQQSASMRRLYPEPKAISEQDEARLEALSEQYDALADDDDSSPERQADLETLEAEIAALTGGDQFAPDQIALAGAFVTLGPDGRVRIERGFVRPEDLKAAPAASEDGERAEAGKPTAPAEKPLSERLVAELTAYRSAGLRHALGEQPGVALFAVVHALALQTFFHGAGGGSCIEIVPRSTYLAAQAEEIAESPALRQIAERHEAWAKRLPESPDALWEFIVGLAPDDVMGLLAHCVAQTVNAVRLPGTRPGARDAHADTLAASLGLDMTAYWKADVQTYFGRVSKERILEAVREGVSKEAAENLSKLKKQAMADAAAKRLDGKGWLPALLR
jgi:ParB family chromosome partitioning protein